jgi:hypothetical protein
MAVDPLWNEVVLYLRFNGVDDATTTTDLSNYAEPVTLAGQSKLSTEQAKFGTASAEFDGQLDWLRINDNAAPQVVVGTQDFTMECWIRLRVNPLSAPDGGYVIAAHYDVSGNNRSWCFRAADTGNLQFFWSEDGVSTPYNASFATTWNINQWYHVAAVREGQLMHIYKDGVRLGTYDAGSVTNFYDPSGNEVVRLGWLNAAASVQGDFDGWIDEFRWTMGTGAARYTGASFTLQTEEFPTVYGIPPPPDNIIVNPKNPGGGVPIPEAEYTTTQTAVVTQSQVQTGGGGSRGGTGKGGGSPPTEVIIDVPSQAGVFDVTCHIEGYDFGSGTWYPVLSGANITAGGVRQRLQVGSHLNDVVNLSANDVLPYMWRCRIEHGDATAITYSVEYKL